MSRLEFLRFHFHIYCAGLFIVALPADAVPNGGSPPFLDGQFDLPPGFRIYRAAEPELAGGGYALAFDGEGRLLVGDGQAVRRLQDENADGIFDGYEIVAAGLGPRGPQGLLVYGDRLYAVGGDGIQLYEGYRTGKLEHRGRLGNPLNTGGDHAAHTVIRGPDGYLYFITGDGGGARDRSHITEESSPVRSARDASVFRIHPDGAEWECLSTGGRNAPNLGMNYLGDLFSLDSDMEWHVALPWYRPVRLNHWAWGGDQGWRGVGAYPPYFIDTIPPILEIGRGSPDWGVFYEHHQFPAQYRNAFFVCDYRWKSASGGDYSSGGRLLAFFLERNGAEWKSEMRVFAKPLPGAKDTGGQPIHFALVDAAVAPDGSLFLSEHNQGIWRILYDPEPGDLKSSIKPITPEFPPIPPNKEDLLEALVSLPQPASEWARRREEMLRSALGAETGAELEKLVLSPNAPLRKRLRAIRLLAPDFNRIAEPFLRKIAADPAPEIRGQAAWLFGLRARDEEISFLVRLLKEEDGYVRRRAAESLTRFRSPRILPALVEHLSEPSRLTRYIAMAALAHHPAELWLERALRSTDPQVRMRALVAARMRDETPPPEIVASLVPALLIQISPEDLAEDQLDLLRLLAIFQTELESDPELTAKIRHYLLRAFPSHFPEVRWEQTRLLGGYQFAEGFPHLLKLLREEAEPVAQFHTAQALARLPSGWNREQQQSLLDWLLSTQKGWFAEFDRKGLQFPHFWATVLAEFARHHGDLFLENIHQVQLDSLMGAATLDLLLNQENPAPILFALHAERASPAERLKLIQSLKHISSAQIAQFLREQLQQSLEPAFRSAALESLAHQPLEPPDLPLLAEGIGMDQLDTARACARALAALRPGLSPDLAAFLLQRLAHPALFHSMEKVLATLSGTERPGFNAGADERRRPEPTVRANALLFWREWHATRFGRQFSPEPSSAAREKTDPDLLRFLSSDEIEGGDSKRGAEVYVRLQCHSCHGGAPPGGGPLFGPDLAGITQRLSRGELAEALVYPSEQVAERFQARELELKNGRVLTGFITEQNDVSLTFVDRDQVRQFSRIEIERVLPQSQSLMPDRLLNSSSDEDLRDLIAYLRVIGTEK